VRAQPAQEGRPACLRRAPARKEQQAQQQEHVQARGQTQLRPAALGIYDRDQLYDQDEQVRACPERISESTALGPEQLHQAAEQPLQGQEHGHDEICCDEDRVAHVGGHALDHVAAPRQWVQPCVLDDAVDGNREGSDDDRVQQPVDLVACAQVRQDRAKDQDVAEERERPLQPDVRAEKADARHKGQSGAQKVAGDQDQRGQYQRGASQVRPPALSASLARQRGVDELNQPGGSHQERDRTHEMNLVRLEDAIGERIEEKRRHHQRG